MFPFRMNSNDIALLCERTLAIERPPLVGEVSVNFSADRGRNMVSVTDLYSRILGFLNLTRYYFFQVAPQMYSRG
jgi:hypothetical protein